jgi:hypothetical protein
MATVKRGNWTEERHEILDKLSADEIWDDIMRIQAENPDRGITAEEFQEKMRRMEEAETTERRAQMVGA